MSERIHIDAQFSFLCARARGFACLAHGLHMHSRVYKIGQEGFQRETQRDEDFNEKHKEL